MPACREVVPLQSMHSACCPKSALCMLCTRRCAGLKLPKGRVQVAGKRWIVDLNARQDATLQLSSVNLPGGVQARLVRAPL